MKKIIGAVSAQKIADMQVDFWEKFRKGNITIEQIEGFLKMSKKKRDEVFGIKETFESNILEKTSTLSIDFNSFLINEDSVRNFFKPVVIREGEKKNPNLSISKNLWKYFQNELICINNGSFFVSIYRLLNAFSHEEILQESERKGIKKIYNYFEAISIIRTAILSGEVDDSRNMSVCVYFEAYGTVYVLLANRGFRDTLTICAEKMEKIQDNDMVTYEGVCLNC